MKSSTNEKKYKDYLKILLQTTAIIAIGASNAYAQDADAPDAEDEPKDEIVVTGSRIKGDTFSSPVSMDVLVVEDAKLEGISDIAGLLQTSTAASGSNQVTAAVSNAFQVNGGLGAENVALRGLAANRTLSLINGRRAGPSGVRGSVTAFDLNSIPLIGIERVDILKDGASSVYGSDAIAGVVNYITDKSEGATIDVFTQISEGGGGEEYRVSGSYGTSFADGKGFARATLDYFKENELIYKDREYLNCDEEYVFDPTRTNRIDNIDPRTGNPVCGGTIWGQIWVYGNSGGDSNIPDNPRNRLLQFNYAGDNLEQHIPALPDGIGFAGAVVPDGWFPVLYDQTHIAGQAGYAGIDVSDNGPNRVTNRYNPLQEETSVTPEVERYTAMFDAEYQLTDSVTAYGEALFNRRSNEVHRIRQYYSFVYGAEFNSAATGAALVVNTNPTAAGWGGPNVYSPTPIAGGFRDKTEIDYFRLVGGLKGDFGNDAILPGWSWDAYVQHSDSHGEYTSTQIYDDAITPYDLTTSSCNDIDLGNGLGVTAGATNAALGITIPGRQCIDVPWFDPEFERGNLSQELRDYLFTESTGTTDFTSTSIEGFISGKAMELPAGDASVALGYFFQRDEITDRPSDLILAGAAWNAGFAGITTGVQKTNALYGEVKIPIIRDASFFEDLTATGSGRFTTISSQHPDGRTKKVDGFNYRLSLDWQIIPMLRARGTMGTSFRAPGLFEQFLADESNAVRQSRIDPCIGWGTALASGAITQTVANNCAADGIPAAYNGNPISASTIQGGGFGRLEPETSRNFTIGTVFTPDFADLSIAFDYFDIEVNNEITTLTPFGVVNGCYSSENFATEPLCNNFDRNPGDPALSLTPFLITQVRAQFVNINQLLNSGIDMTVKYGKDTKYGRFDLRTQWTYQLESKNILLAESAIQDTNGEIGEPKLTGIANLTYDPGKNWKLRYNMAYVGATSNIKRFNRNNPNGVTIDLVPVLRKDETEVTIYHGISGEYDFNSGWIVRAGINNIFDEHPPAVSGVAGQVGNTPIRSQYDLLGRRAFVNITKDF